MARRNRTTRMRTPQRTVRNRPLRSRRLRQVPFRRGRRASLTMDNYREYHPDPILRRESVRPDDARIVVARDRQPKKRLPWRLAFNIPGRVWTCVKRKVRREVLFAKNKTGKGARQTRRRRNRDSNVRC